jgi:hypothetical protein
MGITAKDFERKKSILVRVQNRIEKEKTTKIKKDTKIKDN